MLVLLNYNGDERLFVDFAKFFILNAKVLKKMEIRVLYNRNDKWMHWQRRLLQVENRASQDAQIELKNGVWQNSPDLMHIHDLSMADPFDSSLCGCSKGVR